MGEKYKTKIIWVYLITALAGALNVYAIQKFGSTVSHHTGNASWLAIYLAKMQVSTKFLILLISYFIGSTISGAIYFNKKFDDKKPYEITMIANGILLFFLGFSKFNYIFVLSMILGAQNAMFIKYNNIIVRTSHISGYLTDAGFYFGAYLRGHKQHLHKTKFYLFSIIIFILGGIFGSLIANYTKYFLPIIGLLYICSGLLYKFLIGRGVNIWDEIH